MSKRPTFNDLITHYGDARAELAEAKEMSDTSGIQEATTRAGDARATLTRALRKAGVPLDQVAPQ